MDVRCLAVVLVVALGLSGCVTKENYNKEVSRATNFQRLLSEEEKRTVELSSEIVRLKDQISSLEAKSKTLTAQLNEAKSQVVRSLEEVGRLQDEVKQARSMGSGASSDASSLEPPDRLGELNKSPSAKEKGKAAKPEKPKPAAESPKAATQAPKPVAASPTPRAQSPAPAMPSSKPAVQSPKPAVPAPKQAAPSAAPIPKPAVQAPKPAPKTEPKETAVEASSDDAFFRYHQVKKGETLQSIAKQYRTDVQTLRELNDLTTDVAVKPGDRLIVGQKQ